MKRLFAGVAIGPVATFATAVSAAIQSNFRLKLAILTLYEF